MVFFNVLFLPADNINKESARLALKNIMLCLKFTSKILLMIAIFSCVRPSMWVYVFVKMRSLPSLSLAYSGLSLSLTLIRSGIGNLLEIKGSGGSSKGPDLSQIAEDICPRPI